MNATSFAKHLILLAALLATAQSAGCLSVKVTEEKQGPVIEARHLQTVLRGITTRQQLIEMFGEPTSTSQAQDGTEVLHYVGASRTTTRKKLSPLYSASRTQTIHVHTFFVIKDGTVQDYRIEVK